MTEHVLVFNSGSSSLKFGLYARGAQNSHGTVEEQLVLQGSAEGIGRNNGTLQLKSATGEVLARQDHLAESQEDALVRIADTLREYLPEAAPAIGHRVVHGGPRLRHNTPITPEILHELECVVHFAPLHIPEALRIIRKTQDLFPESPQFACFDTTFHISMPDVAAYLPLPNRFYGEGIQRYGAHGLSCESIMYRLGTEPPDKVIIAHLGSGSSLTAVREGRSIDTTMGLSPTGGIPMATRSGDLDPSVLLYLLRNGALGVNELETLLNHGCGLIGLSGGEADMKTLLKRMAMDDGPATLAVNLFTTDVRKTVGAYAALMGGVDLLVFTGGIGEHSPEVRGRVLDGLQAFGLRADGSGTGKVVVMHAEEEVQIARHCRALMKLRD
ncbi:MAG TPA: acetate kinase [Acidobacteriaceae bacterium]|jgi:acetate kinase